MSREQMSNRWPTAHDKKTIYNDPTVLPPINWLKRHAQEAERLRTKQTYDAAIERATAEKLSE